jgi:hypothetical protein
MARSATKREVPPAPFLFVTTGGTRALVALLREAMSGGRTDQPDSDSPLERSLAGLQASLRAKGANCSVVDARRPTDVAR